MTLDQYAKNISALEDEIVCAKNRRTLMENQMLREDSHVNALEIALRIMRREPAGEAVVELHPFPFRKDALE